MRAGYCPGILLVVLGCSGCATILHGTTQKVDLSSNPAGASARIDPGGVLVTTPASVELGRQYDYQVQFEMPNYKPKRAYVDRETAPATYLNLLLGGIIGLSVDYSSGAAYQLVPDHLDVVLERLSSHEEQARPRPTSPDHNE
jgi:hypothetical protein